MDEVGDGGPFCVSFWGVFARVFCWLGRLGGSFGGVRFEAWVGFCCLLEVEGVREGSLAPAVAWGSSSAILEVFWGVDGGVFCFLLRSWFYDRAKSGQAKQYRSKGVAMTGDKKSAAKMEVL